MFNKNIKLMAFIASALFWGSGFAADVYIEQAGDTSTFNITQAGAGNRVGTSGAVSVFTGNSQTIDITQTGANNTADLTVNGGSTTIDYAATGGSNDLQVEIDGGTGNTFNIVKEGDSNRVTVCGTNNAFGQGAAAGNAVGCSTGVAVNDTTNTINIAGDSNSVNLALASPNATNVINIGQTTASDSNIVNVTQTGALATHNVNATINGNTNTLNITQSQP